MSRGKEEFKSLSISSFSIRRSMTLMMASSRTLCVLSALSSETAGLNLSYGEVIRSRADLCTPSVGHQSALMGNTAAASCACRVLC